MENKNERTKDLFLIRALELFAERGYKAVTVAQIAEAVGCTPPALYKHYAGKKGLFDAILQESERGYQQQMEKLQADFGLHPQQRDRYLTMTEADQLEQCRQLFLHTLHDPWPCAFRKLITVEQFHMPELAALYNRRYVELQYRQYESLFRMMMEGGVLRPGDPMTLAVLFVSPITVLIGVCDRESGKEEWAQQLIERHVHEFNRIYRIDRSAEKEGTIDV